MKLSKIITIILCLEVFLAPLFLLPGTGLRIGSVSSLSFNKIVLMLVLTLAAFFLFLLKSLNDGKIKITRTPLDYLILAFLLFYTLSFIFSKSIYFSLFPWLVVLCSVVFYFLVVNIIEKKGILLWIIMASSFASAVLFLASIFVFRDSIDLINTLGSQSSLAGFAAVGAVLAQTFLLKSREADKDVGAVGGRDFHNLLMIFSFVSLLMFLAVIALINFQIGWVILTAGSLLLIGLVIARAEDIGFKKQWLALPVIIALFGLFFLFLGAPLIYNADLPAEAGLSQQTSFSIAWKAGAKSLFGEGPGNFTSAFSKYKSETFSNGALWQVRFNQASNQWIEILGTSGWTGILSWLLLVVFSVILVFLQGAILPVFLCILIVSFYLSFSPAWWLIFFALIASTIKKGETKEFSFKKSPYSRSLASLSFIASIVLGIFFLSFLGRLYLADYYAKKGDFVEALRYNNRHPDYYLAQAKDLVLQAINFAREGETTQAGVVLGRAINYSKLASDASPQNVNVCEARAVLFEQARGLVQGANEWAKKTYEKCLELEPNNPLFFQQLGIAELSAGEEEKAEQHLIRAVELRGQMSPANYELGRIYYNRDELDRAELYFASAVRVAPDYANAIYSLALVYEKQGRRADALTLLRRVLELNPDSEDVKDKIKALE